MPVAPPLSPEPAPRGTIGTSNSPQIRTSVGDLGGLGRQRHGARQAGRQVGGLVASIRLAIGLVGEQPQVGKPGTDSVEERIGDGAAGHARAV